MFRRSAGSPRHSTVVAYLALFVALSGTAAYAADKLDGGDIAKRSVPGDRLEKGGVGTKEAKDLLAKDFKAGELPTGGQGPQGEQGVQGPAGPSTGPAGGDLTGSYPDPTIGAGRVTADKIGTLPSVAVSHGTTQVGDGSPLNFGIELFDVSQMHAAGGDNTRIVAPIDGIYQVSATVSWLPDISGSRTIVVRKNGAQAVAVDGAAAAQGANNQTVNGISLPVKLAAGDFLQLLATETSPSTVNVFTCTPGTECPQFSMYWVAPR